MSRQLQDDNYVQSFRDLLLGIPALVVAIGVLVFVTLQLFASPTELVDRYRAEARRSYQEKNYQQAKECYERLWLLTGGSPEIRYWLAMSDLGLGHQEAAVSALARLAPLDKTGYAPAHIWWANRYYSVPGGASSTDVRIAEQHLQHALKTEPDNVEAHALLGGLYLATDRAALAEPHFHIAVHKLPLLHLPLAQAYVATGKAELGRIQAEMAQAYLTKQSALDPGNHLTRFQRAQVCLFLKDYSGAASILREGLAASGAARYSRGLGDVYAAWFNATQKSRTAENEEGLRLLTEGLTYDSGNVTLLERLVATSQSGNAFADRAQAVINQSLAQGKSVATIHLFLAMEAHRRGQTAEARRNYEEVYRREPRVAVAVNNLAWLLAHSDPPELERALELIDHAVKQWPEQAEFRDTRGHILTKMKRWDEARAELEAVLAVRTSSPDLHTALAEVYHQLGLPDKADEHRKLSGAGSK